MPGTHDTTIESGTEAPLAKRLRWLAGLIAGFVLLLGLFAAFMTLHLKDQVVRLTSVDDLEAARQAFVPSFLAADFLPSEDATERLLSDLARLKERLARYEQLADNDPTVPIARTAVGEVATLMENVSEHSVTARASLEQVHEAIQFFRTSSETRFDRLEAEISASSRVAAAAEEELRLLSAELLSLSTTIFGATKILNEISALVRYNSTQARPQAAANLSIKSLPHPCLPAQDDATARRCTISNARVNMALANLHASAPEDLQRNIDELRRAANAYLRVSERHFQLLSYNIDTLLDISTATRGQLGASTDVLNKLKKMSASIAETDALLRRAESGEISDWPRLDQSLTDNYQLTYSLALRTADAGVSGTVSERKIEIAHETSKTAWSQALTDLQTITALRADLLSAVERMNSSFQQMAMDQRSSARNTVGIISSLALFAMLLLGLMALFFMWGGQTFVVNPIEKTTRTVLALSTGEEIGPIKFDRRSLGLGSLEDALETLRQANIERVLLTKETMLQRTQIQRAHERLTTIANVAPVGLYEMSRTPTGDHTFLYCSDRFLEMSGQTPNATEQGSGPGFGPILAEDLPAVRTAMDISASTLEPFKSRFRIRKPQGGLSWINVVSEARRETDGSIVWTGAVIDVTSDVERETALREARMEAEQTQAVNEIQALHDGLTGLPNRRYFDQVFAERLADAKAGGPNNALLVRIDLDHFKHVNDTLGHEAGDLVLIRVSDVLRRITRADDFAARIGGDEFSMLMSPGTSYEEATEVTNDLRAALAEPLLYNGNPCRFGSSYGMAHTDDFAGTGDDLNLFADAALYRAKELGRNRVELFTPSLHREIVRNRSLATEIHQALETRQFEPFFQPQVRAETGTLAGVEVLMRWNHPEEGVLSPAAFMNVAEQLRLVSDIDRQIMEDTRDMVARLRDKGIRIPKVSLNVSSERMHDTDVIDLAQTICSNETRVAFELLESILLEDESDLFRFHLDKLRDAGIDIEIDDFGSGHASILSLLESGATALKIDQRLIAPLETDTRTRDLVRAIIEIADTLHIETVAEGVENAVQREYLRALGCDVLQGYFFSKPVNESDFEAFYWRNQGEQSAPLRSSS